MLVPTVYAEGTSVSYSTTNNYDYHSEITMGDYGQIDITADSVAVTASKVENLSIDGENVQVIVMGDYYTQGTSLNPTVGELWSGNAMSASLWNPAPGDIPEWLINKAKLELGYAYLYDGYFNNSNSQPYKPEGATRIGEVLGYDVYAADGETFRRSSSAEDATFRVSTTRYLTDPDAVSLRWAVCNTYRAVGQELFNYALIRYRWRYEDGTKDITGSRAIRTIRGKDWERNASPVTGFLTGNLIEDYTGDYNPVVLMGATRTDFNQYWRRAINDIITLNISNENISRIDFLTLVWELMYIYGEPVMTEQEQYMLLEAYGRKLPWDLNSYQLDAVRNLMCRGICDTDILGWNWYENINFEDACTVLMRVKDIDSRLTFKEFQLTTDLSLLQKGYYPAEVAVTGLDTITIQPKAANVIDSTYYDFYVRREDNRSLFVADANNNPNGNSRKRTAVAPHIARSADEPYVSVVGSLYMGTDEYGYTHFRIPISYFSESNTVYINSMNSASDDPARYTLQLTNNRYGGVFVINGDRIVEYQSFDESLLYDDPANVDMTRYDKAVHTRANLTGTKANNLPYTDWLVDIPRSCFYTWDDGAAKWNETPTLSADWVYGNKQYVWEGCNPATQHFVLPLALKAAEGARISLKDGFTDASGAAKDVYMTLNQVFLDTTSGSYYRVQIHCDTGITKDEVNQFLGYNPEKATTSQGRISASQGYMRRDDNVLLSVDYLKDIGYIKSFAEHPVDLGTVYRLVVAGVNAIETDVYIDPNRSMVIYGQCAYFFDSDRALVWTSVTGQKYIDMCAINGRIGQDVVDSYGTDLGLVARGGEGGVSERRNLYSYGNSSTGGTGTESNSCTIPIMNYSDPRTNNKIYVNTAATTLTANYIAFYNTITLEGGVFFIYAKPQASDYVEHAIPARRAHWDTHAPAGTTVEEACAADPLYVEADKMQKDLAAESGGGPRADAEARDIFVRVFQTVINGDEDLFYSYIPLTPDGRGRAGESAAQIVTTPKNMILFRVDQMKSYREVGVSIKYSTLSTDDLTLDRFFVVSPNYYYYTHDSATKWRPVYMKAEYGNLKAFNVEGYNSFGNGSAPVVPDFVLDRAILGITGLPAIISSVPIHIDGESMSRNGSTTTFYLGAQNVPGLYGVSQLLSNGYLIHEGILTSGGTTTKHYYISIKGYTWKDAADVLGSSHAQPNIGEPNKITDWLAWLKEAQLEDAEDILTICIIAALQWIPRIFMFLFILLMALSMIANVKPWQQFCDVVVDPYKVLTAGRQTVHTIDLKKTILFSLIALVMFGFFQNGLILDIIGWAARAVTGILHR